MFQRRQPASKDKFRIPEAKRGLILRVSLLALFFCLSRAFVCAEVLTNSKFSRTIGEKLEKKTVVVADDSVTLQGSNLQDKPASEFAQGELIVKLKEGYTLDDLKELNDKFGVISSKKVYPDPVDPKQTLKDLKNQLLTLTPDHQSWYWQLDKNSKEYKNYTERLNKEREALQTRIHAQEDLIAHLEQRQKRSPEGAIPPKLENIYLLNTSAQANILSMATEYQSNAKVEYAEPNYKAKVQMLPNDPYYSSSNSWGQGYADLWGLKKIQAERAWDVSEGQGAIVAVIDTGIDYTHEDIAANIWKNTAEIPNNGIDDDKNGYADDYHGYDFAYKDSNPIDDNGHGTHCAGTIAAVGNNYKGIIGIAPKAKVMAVKGLDYYGSGYDTDLANCLIYAADRGADVLSNSWGGFGKSSVIEDAVNYAYSKGCVVVAAAGNYNADIKDFCPANIGNVITVAASDQNDAKCYFSNYGIRIDVAAPGGNGLNAPYNILSLLASNSYLSSDWDYSSYIVGSKYIRLAGTSMACPHVSGVCALIVAQNQAVSNEEVRQILRTSADDKGDLGWDLYFGYGRINAAKALQQGSVCTAKISTPASYATIEGIINISGIADGFNFNSYKVEYGVGDDPLIWTMLGSGYTAVKNNILALNWDTTMIMDTIYTIKLTVMDAAGKRYEDRVQVFVKNTYIISPKPKDFISTHGGIIEIHGTAMATNLINYKIEYYPTDDNGRPSGPVTTVGISLANNGNLPVSKGLLASFDPSVITQASIYTFELQKNTPDFSSTSSIRIYLDPFLKKGWPQKIPWYSNESGGMMGFSGHTVADIDNDGTGEIIIGYGEHIYVFTHEGKPLSGWPQKVDARIYMTPVVADLDGDGFLEIVNAGGKYVWKFDGTFVDGWPNENLTGETSAADVNKDGKLDLVIAQNFGQTMNVVDIHGNSLPGWPMRLEGANRFFTAPHIFIADLDNDGNNEILTFFINEDYEKVALVLKSNGTMKNTFLINDLKGFDRSLALGDLDNDADLEIVFVEQDKKKISVFHHDGSYMEGWPIMLSDISGLSSPSLADMDNDGKPEIIIGSLDVQDIYSYKSILYSFRNNGTLISGSWPVRTAIRPIWIGVESSPGFGSASAGDIDGDGKIEIIASNNSPYLNIITPEGTVDSKFNLRSSSICAAIENTPALADIDNDGKMEIVWVSFNFDDASFDIFVWDLPTPYDPNKIEWGQFCHDARHTGIYTRVDTTPPTKPIVTDDGETTRNNNKLHASWNSTDPQSNIVEYKYKIYFKNGNPSREVTLKNWCSAGTKTEAFVRLIKSSRLYEGVVCYFAVKARNKSGLWSEVGNSDGIMLVTMSPKAPLGLTGKAVSKNEINLKWHDNSITEKGFYIERRLGTSGAFTNIVTLGKNTKKYEDKNIQPISTYQYRIKAYNDIGDSTYSNIITVQTPSL